MARAQARGRGRRQQRQTSLDSHSEADNQNRSTLIPGFGIPVLSQCDKFTFRSQSIRKAWHFLGLRRGKMSRHFWNGQVRNCKVTVLGYVEPQGYIKPQSYAKPSSDIEPQSCAELLGTLQSTPCCARSGDIAV